MRAILLIIALSAGLAACNTVQGVGEDVEDGGQAIENAAQDAAN